MELNSRVVPLRRLPIGYGKSIEAHRQTPVHPRPAATVALLREAGEGLEVLLLKRGGQTRFIPGAYVFPGGRVDREDESGGADRFAMTALRETFEEVGILIPSTGKACSSFPLEGPGEGSRLRRALHAGEISFQEVLSGLGIGVDPDILTPIGHWVTPVQERYRYDTRFFGVEVSETCLPFPDGKELVEGRWYTPHEALQFNEDGLLPMVFPTILTLEALSMHPSPQEALRALGRRAATRLLPKVETTESGIRMTLEGSEGDPRGPSQD